METLKKKLKKKQFKFFSKKKIITKSKLLKLAKLEKKVKNNLLPVKIKLSDLKSSLEKNKLLFERFIRVLSIFTCKDNLFEEINWIQYSDKYDYETKCNQQKVKKDETIDMCFENFAKISSPVGEYVHRFFFEDLHFEVIDMVIIIIASLTISTSIKSFETCLVRFRKSTEEFIRRLKQIVYIESTNMLTSDELIFGKLLPMLWREFNDYSFTYIFNVGSNVAVEIKQQICFLVYEKFHLLLMKISNLYTITSLDYLTIIQQESDIHKSIILFRDKLDILLQMGYTFFLAMIEKDEVYYSLVSASYDSFDSHNNFLLNSSPICTYFDAVIGIAHALKIIYDTLTRVTNLKIDAKFTYKLQHKTKPGKKFVGKDLIFTDVENKLEFFSKVKFQLNEQLIKDYICIPTLTYLYHIFIESGLRLFDFFLFNHRFDFENLNYHPMVVKLDRDIYDDETQHLKKLEKIQFPIQIFNLDQSNWDNYFSQNANEKNEANKLTPKYHPFWRYDLIRLILKNGFIPKQTQIEVAIAAKSKNWFFWESFRQVKKQVLEQFSIATVLKENIIRHREWRYNFLLESLQRKRFLETHLNQYFENHNCPSFPIHYLKTISNLASRLLWKLFTGISDEILRIVFPVRWFDPLLISLSFHVLTLHELQSKEYFKTSLMYETECDSYYDFRPKNKKFGIILQKVETKVKKNKKLNII